MREFGANFKNKINSSHKLWPHEGSELGALLCLC